MEKENGLEIVNYSWTSIIIWTPRGKILMFSRWYRYFQFVSWNKISFWNVIAVVSSAKRKTLQTHSMYYCRKQGPAFSVWREKFFLSFGQQNSYSQSQHHESVVRDIGDTTGFIFTGSATRYKMIDTGNYGKRKNDLMVQRVEWNLRVILSFTQTAPRGWLPVMLSFWTPDVTNKTDESVNPLQQMLDLLAGLFKSSLKEKNTLTTSGSQCTLPQFPLSVDAITWSHFRGLLCKYFQTHSGSLQRDYRDHHWWGLQGN